MAIANQLKTLKEYWLIVLGVIVIVLVLNNFGFSNVSQIYGTSYDKGFGMEIAEDSVASMRIAENDFAPDVEDRKIVKSVSTSVEIERGDFDTASSSLKSYVSEAEGIILNENTNSYGEGLSKRMVGYYSVRIEDSKYDSFISKVKGLGEVESFNENVQDITGNYLALEERLQLEKERLERYEELFGTAKTTDEKISLTDRIFEQEQRIKLLEDSIERKDQRIEYVTVSITLNEEASSFINISLVGLGELVRSFVNSLNSVVTLIFWVIPWLVLIFILKVVWRLFKRR